MSRLRDVVFPRKLWVEPHPEEFDGRLASRSVPCDYYAGREVFAVCASVPGKLPALTQCLLLRQSSHLATA